MIRAEGLSKRYGDVDAIADVSFEAGDGLVVGVVGLNGAGKSTLLRILAGELLPSAGRVWVGGAEMERDPRAVRSRIGYLPEELPLYLDMRVCEYLAFVGELNGVPRGRLAGRIAEVADKTHIGHQLDRIIGELSMGYRKRVGIAQAILHEPEVVILDELTSSLDPAEIVGMRELVRSLGGDRTVFTSSHNLPEVHETCDTLLVLHEGVLVARGSQRELGVAAEQERVRIEVRGEPAALEDALPSGMAVVSRAVPAAGLIDAVVALGGGEREALVEALVRAGVGVRRLEVHRSDLERVFLQLVGERPA